MKTQYLAVVEKIDNHFLAYVPDIPDCMSSGPTIEAALSGLRQEVEDQLADMLFEQGREIPKPTSVAYMITW